MVLPLYFELHHVVYTRFESKVMMKNSFQNNIIKMRIIKENIIIKMISLLTKEVISPSKREDNPA